MFEVTLALPAGGTFIVYVAGRDADSVRRATSLVTGQTVIDVQPVKYQS